jgi:hypothetical protein
MVRSGLTLTSAALVVSALVRAAPGAYPKAKPLLPPAQIHLSLTAIAPCVQRALYPRQSRSMFFTMAPDFTFHAELFPRERSLPRQVFRERHQMRGAPSIEND